MKTLLTKSALSAAIALTLVACGGSSGGLAGIGGSGFISSGSITGFGSVIVNGVKFETGNATFDVDGNLDGTEGDLAIGMVVKVNGSINADGVTGTATSIRFDDELQGPVSDLLPLNPNVDNLTRSFTVLGVTIIIDSTSTTFDISDDVTLGAGETFDFTSIDNDNNIEVSGFFNSSGELLATRVELEDIVFAPDDIVEIKGTISELDGTIFKLGSLITVNHTSAILDDLPNGLADGQLVEVKGTFDTNTNTISATEIEAEDDSIDDTDEFELEGLITDFTDINTNFKVNGIPVDASNATFEPTTLTLKDDLRIEVEGKIVNGILVATEVKLEDGNIKVHASIGTIDVAGNSFTLIPVSGQEITVTVTTGTQFEDDVSASPSPTFNISDLITGTFVEVEGHENDSSNGFTATEVEVKESDDIIVQGNLQDFIANATIQILGVTFSVDFNGISGTGETEFENTTDDEITQDDFINATSTGDHLVKIKDENVNGLVNGIADEIEIETP